MHKPTREVDNVKSSSTKCHLINNSFLIFWYLVFSDLVTTEFVLKLNLPDLTVLCFYDYKHCCYFFHEHGTYVYTVNLIFVSAVSNWGSKTLTSALFGTVQYLGTAEHVRNIDGTTRTNKVNICSRRVTSPSFSFCL